MKQVVWLLIVVLCAAIGCNSPRQERTSESERVGSSRAALTTTDIRPGDTQLGNFGQDGDRLTIGQPITVPAVDIILRSFGFEMATVPSTVVFRGEVYAWDGTKATGPNLYESGPVSTSGPTLQTVTFSTGGLTLTANAQYILFVTASKDVGTSFGNFTVRTDNPYAGSDFYQTNNAPAQWTAMPWSLGNGAGSDLAFITTFDAPAATTTALVTSKTPSASGESVTFTASVTSGAGTPGGSVTFKDGATVLGSVALDGAGNASYPTSTLSVGTHSITATYGGMTGYLGSVSTAVSQVVGKDATTTSLISSVNPSVVGGSVTFTATVALSGAGSGTPTGTVTFRDGAAVLGTGMLNGLGVATFATSALAPGSHAIAADYGADTTFAASTSSTLTQVVNLDGSTVALTSAPNPSSFGGNVTFTATVAATGSGGVPTGTVNFKDGGAVLGTGNVVAGVATFSTSALAAGSHAITADYGGDTKHTAASGGLTQVVNAAATTTVSASLTNPAVFGQSVTFTAKVTGSGGTPSGTVTFLDGGAVLNSTALNGAGQATFTTTTLSVGSHAITISYSGDANFAASTSNTTNQVINKAATTTSLISSSNPSIAGSSVTFTATVKATAPGAGTPTGSVTFKDGAATLGTVALSAGVATFTTTTLAVGTHMISASYAASTSYNASNSANVSQVVNQDGVAASLVSSLSPSTYGTSVTFTVTVTSSGPGGTPTGTVTFKDGATVLGSAMLDVNGMASLSTAALTGGSHTIAAQYGGDPKHAMAAATVAQVVNTADSTTALTSSINPSLFGQSITISAAVTSTAAGSRTGTVTFLDGATVLGTSNVVAGVATYTTAALSVATHMISAVYGGDTNYTTSTSGALSQVVNQASTSTTLVTSSQPALVNTSITFTATVSATAPGAGTRTGSVTFMEGATLLGTGTLNAGGVATFAIATLPAGTHTITAIYGGDDSFLGSTSAPLTQNVSASAATIALTSSPNPSTFGQSTTLTAKITGASGTPTGTVTFSDAANELGTSALDNSATATLPITTLSAGTHAITARYSGSTTYAWVVGSVSHVVNKAATKTTVKSALDPSTVGANVTFTATVTSTVAGFTGQVEFFDGKTSLGMGALTGATATFSTRTLTGGPHAISATYKGDGSFLPSTATAVTQTVDPMLGTGVIDPEGNAGPAATGNPADPGACGCRVTGRATGGGMLLGLAGVLALVVRRRRRCP